MTMNAPNGDDDGSVAVATVVALFGLVGGSYLPRGVSKLGSVLPRGI